MRRLIAAWILATSAIGVTSGVLAQSVTPAPTVEVPPPARCAVEPRTPDSVQLIVATPVVASVAAGPVQPDGTPADPRIEAEITDLVETYVACFNRNDFGRVLALYSDDAIRHLDAIGDALLLDFVSNVATPSPPALAQPIGIIALRDIRLFSDDSAGATLSLHYPGIPVPKHFFLTFVRADGRWLIDNVLGEINFSVP